MQSRMTVGELINSVRSDFSESFDIPQSYLLCAYNSFLRRLYLLLEGDSVQSVTAVDGMLALTLLPEQVKRVFLGENECLRASAALISMLPDSPLYCVTEDGVLVSKSGTYKVLFRTLPEIVEISDIATATVALDESDLPLILTALERYACLYIGDTDRADVFAGEQNSLLADFRRANGVSGC